MPARKVYMLPTPSQARQDTTNAIHQIVLQLEKHLPAFGYELTENINESDLVVGHAGQTAGHHAVDVAHCHGLYPTAHYGEIGWHWAANEQVIANLLAAKEITVPSRWVADIIRRDMAREPHVVPWAIPTHWKRQKDHKGYVLWNKTRADGVCDPTPVIELAKLAPDVKFISTFGEGPGNMVTVGRQPYENMKVMIEDAMVYLATTKETFGIGTLEAMACGIPILGYDWGGTGDLVTHGVSGYLVEPGDIKGLRTGLDYCVKHREILGYNARKAALHYKWKDTAEQFATIYDKVLREQPDPQYKVSVVIPCHDYEQYVGQAVTSALNQQFDQQFEVIVILDNCTDNSEFEVERAYGQFKSEVGKNVSLRIEHVDYRGPARTRNHGIQLASAEYIVCLDADDMLGHPEFLATLSRFLDEKSDHGIAFTGLNPIGADGKTLHLSQWPNGYDFDQQAQGYNQVPTCCMFRKSAWAHAGGYRHYCEPAEDAELWLRMGMLGYKGAQVTKSEWFQYRMHDQSLSHPVRIQQQPAPNFRYFHPWTWTGNRPFAADGNPKNKSWPVRNYDRPLVSIIIPVGPNHRELLPNALDSIWGQTEMRWECIVVNDSGEPLDMDVYPWAKVVDIGVGNGAGRARNMGVNHATAPLIAFLDADDMYYNNFLEETLKAYRRTGRYVYTDWSSLSKGHAVEQHQTSDYEPGCVFRPNQFSIHSIAILMEKDWHYKIGGFDEEMPAWEDTDYFMKLATAGVCGQRISRPLLFYRYTTGLRREIGEQIKDELKGLLYNRYRDYIEGEIVCRCRENKKRASDADIAKMNGEMVRVEYVGAGAKAPVVGLATRQQYGRRGAGDVFFVYAQDILASPNVFVPVLDPLDHIADTPVPAEPEKVLT